MPEGSVRLEIRQESCLTCFSSFSEGPQQATVDQRDLDQQNRSRWAHYTVANDVKSLGISQRAKSWEEQRINVTRSVNKAPARQPPSGCSKITYNHSSE